MLTIQQTDYLLSLPKYAVDKDGNKLKEIYVDLDTFYDHRILLQVTSETDLEYNFLLRIRRSQKYTLNLTLHCQDEESKDCVVRVDYGRIHSNPIEILDTLPPKFHPYAGQILHESHMHYNVDGYKTAAWALPLSKTEFTPIELYNSEFRINFTEAICNFGHLINVQTCISVNNTAKLFS